MMIKSNGVETALEDVPIALRTDVESGALILIRED